MRSFSFPQPPNLSWQRPKGAPLWKPQSYFFILDSYFFTSAYLLFFFSIKRKLLRVSQFVSYSHSFQKNDQRGFPFGNPKLMVFFLFLLLVVIFFGYLAIYTNEYLLLLNNVDRISLI